ncbi:hypothetical protein C5613_27025 [Rhodococcus opacus]|uniref:Uncharacterized protein n=1 Tax=Rhodococcus opacus TaxID=37919 RepID=A0A2S8J2Q3_RHOOP|nr:hypothetical protein C5613_27025 [Rhodococcus opacus]
MTCVSGGRALEDWDYRSVRGFAGVAEPTIGRFQLVKTLTRSLESYRTILLITDEFHELRA